MQRKVSFTWQTLDGSWRWVATHYEGNGIFFGKVTSPFVPNGELGTWYVWELKENPSVRLVKGSPAELNKLLATKQTEKAIKFQKSARLERKLKRMSGI
jgi:hypothetical protein